MKIISKGNKNVRCERCGCVMEYEARDIKIKSVEVSVSAWFTFLTKPIKQEYINCPQCGQKIVIGESCY